MAYIDGVSKFMETYAIDRQDIIAQLAEIYTADASIEIFLLKKVA
jgi:hypothetical protein